MLVGVIRQGKEVGGSENSSSKCTKCGVWGRGRGS